MSFTKCIPKQLTSCSLACLLALVSACGSEQQPAVRTTEADQITIDWPAVFGPAQRPQVDFPHAKHVKQLKEQGCKECHLIDEKGKQTPKLKHPVDFSAPQAYGNYFHGLCIGCHQERLDKNEKAGPVDCGACHRRGPPTTSLRSEIHFDNSLHYRHLKELDKKCEKCHHTYDEKLKKLVYKKETESACSDCHKDVDQGKNLSWKNAAHTDCAGCHVQRQDNKQKGGPVACVGCHDERERAKIKKLDKVPRLERKQPNQAWIHTKTATLNIVPFDHAAHETKARFCTACHHDGMKRCGECHTLQGERKGAGVTLEQAQHASGSSLACVGCHRQESLKPECSGCHEQMPVPPGRHGCVVCHAGPLAKGAPKQPSPELFAEVKPQALPETNKDSFPDKIKLDTGGKKYKPTEFPHLKIVKKLYALAGKSKLAARFHGGTEVFCAGCHHHSPSTPGASPKRPPSCASCHGAKSKPGQDLPDLKSAYHRQCIGCHQAMGLETMGVKKPFGCTGCHKEEDKEVAK
ncbi:MAG TPA: cytochrome c3 family protein [Myxococcota bacterium]|nr:cytochrome c3 family protein [Myxococcota bacterium]